MHLNNPTDQELKKPFGYIVPIPGFTGYLISKDGIIWRTHFKNRNVCRTFNPPVRLSIRGSNSGYPRASLTRKGKQETHFLHHLVLLAFAGPRPEGFIARHKNGIRSDCRSTNLEWSTPRQNYDDMVAHGTVTAGTRNGNAVLKDSQVTAMRQLKADGVPTRELAERFGVSRTCVQKICNGAMWKHLPIALLRASGVTVEGAK